MDDLTDYIEERVRRDPELAEGLESGYQDLKARVLRGQAAARPNKQSGQDRDQLGEQNRKHPPPRAATDIDVERRCDDSFARSAKQLAKLADEALREHELGKTQELDPDRL